ncbi:hypothetical protein V8E53_010327 [Lactarius tabidus]
MSSKSTRNSSFTNGFKCPDCGMTLSGRSVLRRHRRTQHPDGTEFTAHCPYPSCEYKADQRSNLNAHMNVRHSNEPRYPCPDCGKGCTDPGARFRHRKTAHGHQPYHTPHYYARRALQEAEKRAKAATGKTRNQQAANVFPQSTQSASSSTSSSALSSADSLDNLLGNTTYHNDFWKPLVDVPCRDASDLTVSQKVQISAPVAAAPARGAPKTLYSDSDLSSPKIGQQPTTNQSGLPATFPSSGGQSRAPTHPGAGFQSLPTFSFTKVPSSMPNFNSSNPSTASSSFRISGPQFISPNYPSRNFSFARTGSRSQLDT